MNGSKRLLRPGVWELRVYVGTFDGKPVQKSRTWPPLVHGKRARGSVSGANKALRELIAEVEAGKHDPKADPGTVAQMLAQWIEDKRRSWQPRTRDENKAFVDRYLAKPVAEHGIGNLQAAKVRAADLNRLYNYLADNVGVPTARRAHVHLSAAFNAAIRRDELVANPCRKAEPPKATRRDPGEIALADVAAVIAHALAVEDWAMAVLIRLALATGARRGEVAALRWSDLDLKAGRVTIRRALTLDDGKVAVKGTKTGTTKVLALDAGTVRVLTEWKRHCATEMLKLGAHQTPRSYVWASSADGLEPWHPDTVTDRWGTLRDAAGVSLRFHDIRHATASFMVAEGVGLAEAAARHGGTVEVMASTYVHAAPARDEALAARIGDAIDVALSTEKE